MTAGSMLSAPPTEMLRALESASLRPPSPSGLKPSADRTEGKSSDRFEFLDNAFNINNKDRVFLC